MDTYTAQMCYRDLTAGQLPLDDHHIIDWLATHPPIGVSLPKDEEDLDDELEELCTMVRAEEAKAKVIAGKEAS